MICTVYAIVDGKEPDIRAGKEDLGVVADLQVISAQATHVLDDDGSNLSVFREGNQSLPVGAVKVGAGVAIVHEELSVAKSIVIGIFLQDCLLVDDGVAVTLQFIVARQAAV